MHLFNGLFCCLIIHLPWVHRKVSTLTNSNMNQGLGITVLNQAFEDFEHGLDSILTNSVETFELDAFLMSLIPCLCQSLQGLYALLVPFMMILDCSLLLVSMS